MTYVVVVFFKVTVNNLFPFSGTVKACSITKSYTLFLDMKSFMETLSRDSFVDFPEMLPNYTVAQPVLL